MQQTDLGENETPNGQDPQPQEVQWGPVDGKPAGIQIKGGEFIPWSTLATEMEQRLLTQVESEDVLPGSKLFLLDFEGKKDWLVRVLAPNGIVIGGMWFGPNPEKPGAPRDGLIRIGKSYRPPVIWAVFSAIPMEPTAACRT